MGTKILYNGITLNYPGFTVALLECSLMLEERTLT